MAKLIKSFFQTPSDKRRNSQYGNEDDGTLTPPLGGRRKLSISRSGRLKQSNKKRHSISVDLYGENLQSTEKTKPVEYHVNTPVNQSVKNDLKHDDKKERRHSMEMRTPEEEIDIAFNVIDKT